MNVDRMRRANQRRIDEEWQPRRIGSVQREIEERAREFAKGYSEAWGQIFRHVIEVQSGTIHVDWKDPQPRTLTWEGSD